MAKKPACPECGTSDSIYARVDLKWTGTAWQVCIGQEENFECSNCDAEFGEEESGLTFPEVEIAGLSMQIAEDHRQMRNTVQEALREACGHLKAVRDAFNEPHYGDRDQQADAVFDALEKARPFLEKMES